MASFQLAKLGDIQYVPSSVGSVYSNPASTKTFVRSILLYNGDTVVQNISLHNVADSAGSVGTAGAGNRFFKQNLAADETLEIPFGYALVLTDTNDSIQAVTTTASKVTIMLMGDTYV